jgi:hypothetical protein
MWSSFPSAKPAALSRIMGRILLANVEARTGKDMVFNASIEKSRRL